LKPLNQFLLVDHLDELFRVELIFEFPIIIVVSVLDHQLEVFSCELAILFGLLYLELLRDVLQILQQSLGSVVLIEF
jgi:hypothetical protein